MKSSVAMSKMKRIRSTAPVRGFNGGLTCNHKCLKSLANMEPCPGFTKATRPSGNNVWRKESALVLT